MQQKAERINYPKKGKSTVKGNAAKNEDTVDFGNF